MSLATPWYVFGVDNVLAQGSNADWYVLFTWQGPVYEIEFDEDSIANERVPFGWDDIESDDTAIVFMTSESLIFVSLFTGFCTVMLLILSVMLPSSGYIAWRSIVRPRMRFVLLCLTALTLLLLLLAATLFLRLPTKLQNSIFCLDNHFNPTQLKEYWCDTFVGHFFNLQ